ncbi:ubiquitin carboxyl-terminal hydrolase 20-like [Lolium rigidum]|uniref:ubiquitin carboxyl-terminal hydrolase 20-like n=1 Tax=Lolium rigidum TaxID=89674 RepID=UPI001F5E1DEA|nr:ubiquitin carboxyl-terminal hydrolase 20-like [Lolium rigidum]
MIEVMDKGGGIGYDIPHLYKDRLQAEGGLGISLTMKADLLVKTRDLIRASEVHTKQDSLPIHKIKQQSSNEKENKKRSFHSGEPHLVGGGLRNMGNTCFLNATLQSITHTVPLFQKLRCTDHSTPCSYDEDGFCSFCALKEHTEESIQRPGSVLMPTRFIDNLSKLNPGFIQGQQEDAHEFLRYLLDNLHKCTLDNTFDEKSIVKQVFEGRLKSQLTCHDCGHCPEILEPFLDLSLEIDQVDNLVAALESFTKVEQIGDAQNKLTCDSCNAEVCKDKRFVIDKAPDVVAFHLKRFATLDGSIDKIDKHVAYPSELDLKPFHSNPDKEGLKYDLYALVEHSGLPNFGHYVCTIRSSPTNWHLMNDSLVHSISETSALGQEAYILFYVRQGSFPWFSNIQEEAKLKKAKAAAASKSLKSFLQDQISSQLMKGMMTPRKKCFVKELDSLGQNASFGY